MEEFLKNAKSLPNSHLFLQAEAVQTVDSGCYGRFCIWYTSLDFCIFYYTLCTDLDFVNDLARFVYIML